MMWFRYETGDDENHHSFNRPCLGTPFSPNLDCESLSDVSKKITTLFITIFVSLPSVLGPTVMHYNRKLIQ